MTKAVEKALEWYHTVKYNSDLSGSPISGFVNGYNQAVADALKWLSDNYQQYAGLDSCKNRVSIDKELITDFIKFLEE